MQVKIKSNTESNFIKKHFFSILYTASVLLLSIGIGMNDKAVDSFLVSFGALMGVYAAIVGSVIHDRKRNNR